MYQVRAYITSQRDRAAAQSTSKQHGLASIAAAKPPETHAPSPVRRAASALGRGPAKNPQPVSVMIDLAPSAGGGKPSKDGVKADVKCVDPDYLGRLERLRSKLVEKAKEEAQALQGQERFWGLPRRIEALKALRGGRLPPGVPPRLPPT